MIEKLPEVVDTTMRKLCESLQNLLPNTIESVYVYGSTALNAYIEGSSDIDFLAIVNRTLLQSDIELITKAHEEVEQALPDSDIMGAYIRREDLGRSVGEIPPVPTYHDKKLQSDGNGDLNPVTWWVMREHGICVYGQRTPFNFELSSDKLIDYVIENMNTYWSDWIARLEQKLNWENLSEHAVPSEKLDFAVEWCVLGMLRQYYSIRECNVTSKIGAGEYGLKVLPERWHGLIREAIAIKRRESGSVYTSQKSRLDDLIKLLRFIHSESNHFVGKKS
ncbi:nucleotidyltransferase domain-containing protein [Paenibacillus hamazuiensis]|uniref:nucleotidyltransferase domain-containing protein n=1 Tax=Paenibacillus hamazuiensis TaxID=2936508 RepID=UPI00200BD20C|nr:nucleotidyltransferase domain-containing protein [Paenibacillus hamazuiensis]